MRYYTPAQVERANEITEFLKTASLADDVRRALTHAAVAGGVGLTVNAGAGVARKAWNRITEESYYRDMLKVRPELHNFSKEQVLTTLRAVRELAPNVMDQPLLAASVIENVLVNGVDPSTPKGMPRINQETMRTLSGVESSRQPKTLGGSMMDYAAKDLTQSGTERLKAGLSTARRP